MYMPALVTYYLISSYVITFVGFVIGKKTRFLNRVLGDDVPHFVVGGLFFLSPFLLPVWTLMGLFFYTGILFEKLGERN